MNVVIKKQPYEEIPLYFDFGSLFGVNNPARIGALRQALTDIGAASTLVDAQNIAAAALDDDTDTMGRTVTTIQAITVIGYIVTGGSPPWLPVDDDIELGSELEQSSEGLLVNTVIRGGTLGRTYKLTCRVEVTGGPTMEKFELDAYLVVTEETS